MKLSFDNQEVNRGDIEEYRKKLARECPRSEKAFIDLSFSVCEEMGDRNVWYESNGQPRIAASPEFVDSVMKYLQPHYPEETEKNLKNMIAARTRVINPLCSLLWDRAKRGDLCTNITGNLSKIMQGAESITSNDDDKIKAFKEGIKIMALLPPKTDDETMRAGYEVVEKAIRESVYWKEIKLPPDWKDSREPKARILGRAFPDVGKIRPTSNNTQSNVVPGVTIREAPTVNNVLNVDNIGNVLQSYKLPSVPEILSGDVSTEEYIDNLTDYIGDMEAVKVKVNKLVAQIEERISNAQKHLSMVKCREQVIQKIIIDEDIEESDVNKLDIELKKKEDRHVAIKEDLLEWQKQIECKNPEQKKVIVNRFDRDERLSKYIKELYNWKCQFPNCELSFLKRDGQPYIEVHHLFALSKDGHDSIENILVVCAHHHRMLEYADVSILNVTPEKVIVMINGEHHVIKRIILQSAGTTITNATLHNEQEIVRKDITAGLNVIAETPDSTKLTSEGKNFALTGMLSSMTRAEANAAIKAAGGRVTSSVTKKTDYVIAGESPGSKYDRAMQMGITILNEEEFKKLVST